MPLHRPRILLVDDNPEIHEDFKKILLSTRRRKDSETKALERELFGTGAIESETSLPAYEIDDAFQGEEAILMVDRAEEQGHPYSLAFMDVRMPPGIDGIVTTERLWQKHPYLEVVICTAYSDYSWDQMLARLGINDHLLFIKKPFDGVSIKQIALALATKWELGRRDRDHMEKLEAEVDRRTAELRAMMQDLSVLKDNAEAATRAKSEFLSNMSHEIRTPLNAMIGFSELLKESRLTEQQRDYADTISTSGEYLLSLINDILDIAKIESRMIILEEMDFDLEYLIRSVLKILHQGIQVKNIDLNLVYSSAAPRQLKGDPTRIRQIFVNLVGNAIKFTEQGEVSVMVSADTSSTDLAPAVAVAVRDTGIGIPKKKLKEIFEAFTQVDSSVTRKYGGSGLGLTITKSLVAMMGGEINVQSEPGKGSSFSFVLHLKPGQAIVEKNIVSIGPEDLKENTDITRHMADELVAQGIHVLVVEDNVLNQRLMSNLLNKMGCTITIANNGQEAVDTVRTTSFDIILMDIQMPVMDGFASSRIIRNELKSTVPIIALTAHVFQDDKQNSMESGMNDFVTKPVDFKALKEKIMTWRKK